MGRFKDSTRQVSRSDIDALYKRIQDLENELSRVQNDKRGSIPIYDARHLPTEAPVGQIISDIGGTLYVRARDTGGYYWASQGPAFGNYSFDPFYYTSTNTHAYGNKGDLVPIAAFFPVGGAAGSSSAHPGMSVKSTIVGGVSDVGERKCARIGPGIYIVTVNLYVDADVATTGDLNPIIHISPPSFDFPTDGYQPGDDGPFQPLDRDFEAPYSLSGDDGFPYGNGSYNTAPDSGSIGSINGNFGCTRSLFYKDGTQAHGGVLRTVTHVRSQTMFQVTHRSDISVFTRGSQSGLRLVDYDSFEYSFQPCSCMNIIRIGNAGTVGTGGYEYP